MQNIITNKKYYAIKILNTTNSNDIAVTVHKPDLLNRINYFVLGKQVSFINIFEKLTIGKKWYVL